MSNPNPAPTGPPLRALAMVLIALAILFAGIGALSWSSGADDESLSAENAAMPRATVAEVPAAVANPPRADVSAASTSATALAGSSTRTTAVSTTTARAQASTTTTSGHVSSATARSVPVRVLNNSAVTGLAADTASELRGEGWTVTQTGNFNDRDLTESTVYYGNDPGAKEAATMIAEQIDATTAPATPVSGAESHGVTVILTGE